MSDDESIKGFTERVVIIDDGFAPAQMDMIEGDDWALLRENVSEAQWAPIRQQYFTDVARATDLKSNDDALRRAWQLYDNDPGLFSLLDPIFQRVRQQKAAEITRLQTLLEYFGTDLNVSLCKHSTIDAAIEDIKGCKLIFLDFYLYQTSSDKVIEDIRRYGTLFADPVVGGDGHQGRIVILISTDLPSSEKIELFRKATKLKGAFFKPVAKAQLTKEWLRREIANKVSRYGDMQRWVKYLDTFSNEITEVASSLREEIEGLELHDLAILDSVRLQKDSEPLGDYLSWLFSDSLAARLRNAAPLAKAGGGVDEIAVTPFHGMLSPKSILFGLYSDIAFASTVEGHVNPKVRFADVYTPITSAKAVPAAETPESARNAALPEGTAGLKSEPSNQLLLVIAPACDLQRCPADYEVLCVRGEIIKTSARLSDILSQQPMIGKANESESVMFRHLLRQSTGDVITFYNIEWKPKRITTILASELGIVSKYVKRGQLNELLGHEIKEEALRQAGRVGVPVDPSFSTALSAAVHLARRKQPAYVKRTAEDQYIAGIFVSANEQNPAKILPSEEFLEFLGILIAEVATWNPPVSEKHLRTLSELQTASAGIELGTNYAKPFDGGFKVKLIEQYKGVETVGENAIVFFPVGRVLERSEEEPHADFAAAVKSLDSASESIAAARDVIAAAEDVVTEREGEKASGTASDAGGGEESESDATEPK